VEEEKYFRVGTVKYQKGWEDRPELLKGGKEEWGSEGGRKRGKRGPKEERKNLLRGNGEVVKILRRKSRIFRNET